MYTKLYKVKNYNFCCRYLQPLIRNIILENREERGDCGNYSDIINVLSELSPQLDNSKSYGPEMGKIINNVKGDNNFEYGNAIYIFSDMINEGREGKMNFTRLGYYNHHEIIKLVDKLKSSNEIPNLKNCKIFVNGATTLKNTGANANKQFENIRGFWENFFKESGADLSAYGFDTKDKIVNYLTRTEN